jgi:hypothetical protein
LVYSRPGFLSRRLRVAYAFILSLHIDGEQVEVFDLEGSDGWHAILSPAARGKAAAAAGG